MRRLCKQRLSPPSSIDPNQLKYVHGGHANRSVVSQPYFRADHQLIYPPEQKSLNGSKSLLRRVDEEKTEASVSFRSVQMPDGTTRDIHSTVGGIQAERSEGLNVGRRAKLKLRHLLSRGFSLPFP